MGSRNLNAVLHDHSNDLDCRLSTIHGLSSLELEQTGIAYKVSNQARKFNREIHARKIGDGELDPLEEQFEE
ncbi:hypothetical protein A3D88_02760 [Candidatus Peribacteria bacterium RIFCSPHIGHO2_02_FULL_52_16]|nr:MAG: hypothetical protein A2706_00585 [Candidatus Peribacteria bacterium RIFCSPHIGHO2_01_FULL_51_35]OGJ61680.1 MAG: hypothetical protein A3D88_02760 [Candidatus Peribacteria bacterium RIFCSPHIGHO2_02_FULL_52_16]